MEGVESSRPRKVRFWRSGTPAQRPAAVYRRCWRRPFRLDGLRRHPCCWRRGRRRVQADPGARRRCDGWAVAAGGGFTRPCGDGCGRLARMCSAGLCRCICGAPWARGCRGGQIFPPCDVEGRTGSMRRVAGGPARPTGDVSGRRRLVWPGVGEGSLSCLGPMWACCGGGLGSHKRSDVAAATTSSVQMLLRQRRQAFRCCCEKPAAGCRDISCGWEFRAVVTPNVTLEELSDPAAAPECQIVMR